ncbi:hypothetical protein HC766_04370 [Candidatus Gracilibacteria bacterium]|nr:hypothetical protein [Candidatus Gracilibacteria bacterium]
MIKKRSTKKVNFEKIKNESVSYFEVSSSKKRRKNPQKNSNALSALSPQVKASFVFLSFALLFLMFSVVSVFAFQSKNFTPKQTQPQVAGASVIQEPETDEASAAYKEWMLEYSADLELPDEDLDVDGLTNMEEFLIGSNPAKATTCGDKRKDAEKLIELTDPVTCKQISLENTQAIKKYEEIVDFAKLRNSFFKEIIKEESAETEQKVDANSLQSVFGVDSVEGLNSVSLDKSKIDFQIKQLEEQKKVIDLIAKVDEYIKLNRSLEPYDREYEIPVSGAVYVDVAKRYDTPLKYVLAIAQRESRFGTDRYTKMVIGLDLDNTRIFFLWD